MRVYFLLNVLLVRFTSKKFVRNKLVGRNFHYTEVTFSSLGR